jgi:enoyl-CoA hydratase/carnithine racemase
MTDLVLAEAKGGVLRLTLNEPSTRNSLSDRMMSALGARIAEAEADTGVRTIVIAAAGPAFSAGHNLKDITAHRKDEDKGRAYFTGLMKQCAALMQAIVNCPKPVIAEVHAVASAAGCQLVATCDLAVASEEARFATPGGRGGWFCTTPMVAVSRAIGRKRALEMLLTGDDVDARTAAEWGLVNRVVPADRLVEETAALARRASRGSTASKALGKHAYYAQIDMDQPHAYAYASEVMAASAFAPDGREALLSFVEKRKPRYS